MNVSEEKYNNGKARYIAMLIVRNRHNKNSGLEYTKAVMENNSIKASIDYWLEMIEQQGAGEGK